MLMPSLSRPAPGTLIVHDPGSTRPRPATGAGMALWHLLCRAALKLGGWRIEGDWPDHDRVVITAAPHTSNWDGIWMLAAAGAWRARLRYMGKASLTQGPFGWLVRATGCIPIDRSQSNDVVATMARAFAAHQELILVVPPEGTRKAVEKWKSGFYHIAVAAGVPISFAVMDYASRTVRLAATLWPSGDYSHDLPIIQRFYANAMGKHPEEFVLTGR
jgi:1-acyl-sn-glycerol-3-phosphate acyltransferase